MRSRANREVSFDRRCEDVDVTGDDQKCASPVVEQRRASTIEPGSFEGMFDRFAVKKRGERRPTSTCRAARHSCATSRAYALALANKSSCAPRSLTLPFSRKMISSQSRMVLKRWAMMMQAQPRRRKLSSI